MPSGPPDDIESRLSAVEREVAQLRSQVAITASDAAAARVLAAGADRDVSEVRAELRAHTQALNALRETQLEQGQMLAEQGQMLAEHGRAVAEQGQAILNLDHKMTDGFTPLRVGMEQIHALLVRIAPGE